MVETILDKFEYIMIAFQPIAIRPPKTGDLYLNNVGDIVRCKKKGLTLRSRPKIIVKQVHPPYIIKGLNDLVAK